MASLLQPGDTDYDNQILEAYGEPETLPSGYPGANSARAWATDAELQKFLDSLGAETRERVEALI